MKKKGGFLSYLNYEWDNLKNSFISYKKKSLMTIIYDIFFYLIVIISSTLYGLYLQFRTSKINLIDIQQTIQDPSQSAQVLGLLKRFLFFDMIGCFILLSIIIFLAVATIKPLIWAEITNNKLNKKDIIRFWGTRALWSLILIPAYIIAVPLFAILIVAVKSNSSVTVLIVSSILLVSFLFFTNTKIIMYIIYTKTKSLKSIFEAFKIGFKKIHYFIIPYLVILASFIAFTNLTRIFFFVPEQIQSYISAVLIIIYISWFRFYVYEVNKRYI